MLVIRGRALRWDNLAVAVPTESLCAKRPGLVTPGYDGEAVTWGTIIGGRDR